MIYIERQPSERTPETIDFTDKLPTGQTLDPVAVGAVTARNAAGTDVTATLISGTSISSPYVTIGLIPIAAGLYKIRFLMPTTPGSYLIEQDVTLRVREE